MSTQDTTAPPTGLRPWPVVRHSTRRFVRVCRVVAVLLLIAGVAAMLTGAQEIPPSPWFWAAVTVGGLVHLAGVAGLWFLPSRCPERVSPRPGPQSGTERERRRARRTLRRGEQLDEEGRRLVAVEVAAGARTPLVVAGAFAILGPVAVGTPNTSEPLPWVGPVTAAVALLVVLGLAWQVRTVRRLHQAALRADALPRFEARDAPYLP